MMSGTLAGPLHQHHQPLQKPGLCSRSRPGLVARRQARATQVLLPPVQCATSSHFSQQQGEHAHQPSILPSQPSLSFDAVVSPSSSSPQRQQRQQFRHAFASLTSDSLDSWDFDDHHQGLPGPSNTPTHEDDDADELLYAPRRDIDMWTLTDQPGIDLLLAGPGALEHLQQVYVILFGVGERDTEGIYSLRAFGDDGLPQETIIVFEIEEDAQRYAGLLEATMDHTPNVCSIPPRELLDFCVDQGYHCRMEPCGSLLIPPDFNVGVTDWERSMRLR
ncbi:hypothetical protein DUNSADRAFT_17814 [Dunaliella salina]|uniref:Uncharacterized protein n=1 Tax=Dunaliella salina TaxID=3046 RepID=A0ABQ7GZP9_DUNSA|nr:hypothetical protein DUNSADRAFT_17814 [Dunaliella salina]|eukprot:KAF5840079.1 hypothetical protein DUNSADRAFT_17814 [Dunaliella salina]